MQQMNNQITLVTKQFILIKCLFVQRKCLEEAAEAMNTKFKYHLISSKFWPFKIFGSFCGRIIITKYIYFNDKFLYLVELQLFDMIDGSLVSHTSNTLAFNKSSLYGLRE